MQIPPIGKPRDLWGLAQDNYRALARSGMDCRTSSVNAPTGMMLNSTGTASWFMLMDMCTSMIGILNSTPTASALRAAAGRRQGIGSSTVSAVTASVRATV